MEGFQTVLGVHNLCMKQVWGMEVALFSFILAEDQVDLRFYYMYYT